MSKQHEHAAGITGATRNKRGSRGRNKKAAQQPQDPSASSYGQVQFQELPDGPWTELRDLAREAAVGSSVVVFGEVKAIRRRPFSNTAAAVVLQRYECATVRCVVVAGAFEGVTERMVRFAVTLPRNTLVIAHGVVSRHDRPNGGSTIEDHEVEIQVKKHHCPSYSNLRYRINLEDVVGNDEERLKAAQACPVCASLRN